MNNPTLFLRVRKGLIASLFAITTLTACSSGKWGFPYVAPVQQGNWITAEQVSLLQRGMSPQQVQYATLCREQQSLQFEQDGRRYASVHMP